MANIMKKNFFIITIPLLTAIALHFICTNSKFDQISSYNVLISNTSNNPVFVAIRTRGSCKTLCESGKSGPPCYTPTGCCDSTIIPAGNTKQLAKYQNDAVVLLAFPQTGGTYFTNTSEPSVTFPNDFEQARDATECSGDWPGWPAVSWAADNS